MWYVYSMEYYSTFLKNDIRKFAATWVELGKKINPGELFLTQEEIWSIFTYAWTLDIK